MLWRKQWMIHSFVFGNIRFVVSDSIYEPAEDSFLLAKYAPALHGRILDVGTGSGMQALVNAQANPENEVIGTDVNPEAVECAAQNAKRNKIPNARFFVSDLFEDVTGKFDGIIFNPPYLPSIKMRDQKRKITEIALSGGKIGREITDCFLEQFPKYLNKNGTALLHQSSINNIEKTRQMLSEKCYGVQLLAQENFFFEKLYVLKIRKAQ